MAGVYIPGITKEMFQNAPLEAIEELIASGEIIEVSDHGDLIDMDNMLEDFAELRDYDFALRQYVVIPADKEEI